MYLKSLEIHGFKSFPDKIKLTFDKGITGVVGPNGSGKSNIGDAVRWVLGEQSTKTLRGNKMEDIIFAGTASRKPVGFASVTLVIDNSGREFDVDGDEVAVMRKLYRSGESEYRLNGKNVRLKDINELFMDTGLGRDGYSIIGQGRISEIVSAKSNERRDIFEEAAGISKFRYKKAEAEKKLAQAQDNLLRLRDIISELESRVEPLRIQAEKAKKFAVLAAERRKTEISIWVKKLSELRKSIEQADEKILICKSQYEAAEHDTQKLEAQRKQCGVLIQQCSEKIEDLQKKILETEKNSSQYKSDTAVCENDIIYCRKNIMSLVEKQTADNLRKNECLERLEEYNKKKALLDEKSREISQNLENIENQFLKAEKDFESIDRLSDEKAAEISSLYRRKSEYSLTVNSSESIISEIKAQTENVSRQNDEYERLCESYKNEQLEIKESIIHLSELEQEHKNRLKGFSMLYENAQGKLSEHKKKYDSIILDINSASQKIKIMQELEKNMEGFSYSVKEIMKASENHILNGIKGTVAHLINVDSRYSVAVETALGGALQNIVVDNEQTAKNCIGYLKQHRAGRSTFLPVTSVKGNALSEYNLKNEDGFIAVASEIINTDEQYRGIIRSLLGRTVIADDIDSAADIARKNGYKFRIVTLDGQLVNAGGSFTGGSQARSAGVLSRKNEIDKLKNDIASLEKTKSGLEKSGLAVRNEIEKINKDTENIRNELSQVISDRAGFEAEEKRLSMMAEQSEIQLKNSRISLNTLEKRLETQQSDYKNAAEQLEKINAEIAKAENSIAAEKNSRETLRKKREQLSEKLSQYKINDMEVRKDIQLAEGEIRSLENTINSIDNENNRTASQIRINQQTISDKEAKILEIKQSLEKIKTDSEHFSSETDIYRSRQKEHELQRDKINSDIRSLGDTKQSLAKELARLEERRNTVLKENDSIIAGIWENYELTRSEAESIAEPVENMIKYQQKLNDIKNKIRSLGNINADAVDEYAEVSERYNFMSEQIKDVETSKKELEKLIENLTADMCRIFSECFEDINKNFQNIFRELFGGGNAELILTEPENVLESGIEIIVAPPGKVIKNLISLSGGEQSFIAIALYFAILKIRPAPFCILDEIDAALDDVNVSKYASYLKNFTDSTQFITVTHRRGTMEAANVLYGVTMQENGVSKLLRLDNTDFEANTQV